MPLSFEIEPWEAYCDYADAGLARDGRCAWPDCRRRFDAAKPWQRFCCAACRRADQDEARKVGHMLARPVLALRETKHAPKGSIGVLVNSTARRYVDQLASRWREDRMARARAAEAALDAGSAAPRRQAA